jgi:hypothetical protein
MVKGEIWSAHTLAAGRSTCSANNSLSVSADLNAYLLNEDLIESFIFCLFNIGCYEWTVIPCSSAPYLPIQT